MFEIKDKGCSPEDALRLAATLISENLTAREVWVEEHKELVNDWKKLTSSLDMINYVALSCFAPIYIVDNTFTRLDIRRDCIRAIHPLCSLKSFIDRVKHSPTSGFVLFKRVNNYFEEVSVKCGYSIGMKDKEFMGLTLPIPKNAKFWVEIADERFECSPPNFKSSPVI